MTFLLVMYFALGAIAVIWEWSSTDDPMDGYEGEEWR